MSRPSSGTGRLGLGFSATVELTGSRYNIEDSLPRDEVRIDILELFQVLIGHHQFGVNHYEQVKVGESNVDICAIHETDSLQINNFGLVILIPKRLHPKPRYTVYQ